MKRMLLIAMLALIAAVSADTGEWPSFRGTDASGVSDGQDLPVSWNVATGENIRWTAPIPGLAHSSPIVSNGRVFVTSAVSSRDDATFKPGLYGEGTASEDRSVHKWVVMAFDAKTGRAIWQQTAFEGAPREKRHIKSTYASATPATDGRILVAFFGSQGLYAYTVDGTLLWKKDLGHLDVGAYDIPSYEWGTASSPVIHDGKVIVQVDTSKDDYLLALDAKTGREIWRTPRQELPSWGTPTVVTAAGRTEIVTNSSNFVYGYDIETGKELWRLGGSSQITAPTPIFTPDAIIVASGRRPTAPILAIKPGARGDITGTASVLWQKTQRGPYMPTPVIYRDQLYVLGNAGIFDSYNYRTGEEIYRSRLLHKGSGFSASPVISDGRLYASSEDGDIFVVKTGPEFEVLAQNAMGEPLMATPAIAGQTMFVRGQRTLWAIGKN
ncbi:MAG TPA: PQQ-binding-like beta-propeller repeat protein [Vicinamibacterales bacterium]|nr:PQQ-binding-like beta-propeller repeat protein [Vicinamibacterales bacterium]